MYRDLLIFIIGIAVIVKSADLFTDGAEGIARAFKIPRVIIGLTIVSLATTAPEVTVSAISSLMNVGGMALGNALGSCLVNIGLVLAIAVIIRPINFQPKIFRRELPFLIAVILLLFLFIRDNKITGAEGVFLCLILVGFFTFIVFREIKNKEKTATKTAGDYSIKKDSLKFLLGAIGVIIAAKYSIVPSGINIAKFLGVPEVVIGLSLVAIGTSLPELFTALIASFKNMGELAIGNVIGANILNILLVLGVSSFIRPIDVDIKTKIVTVPMVFFITLLMCIFSRTKFKLTRSEGIMLLAVYSGYMFYIFKFAYN